MAVGIQVMRWVIAVPVATLSFMLGFMSISLAWKHLDLDPIETFIWMIAFGTILATSVGASIVPLAHRKIALWLFPGIVVSLALFGLLRDLITQGSLKLDLLELFGSLGGGIITAYTFRRLNLSR